MMIMGFTNTQQLSHSSSAIARRRRLNFRNSRSTRSEDLCVVGIAVKAITLWGQKCQSSSRTILQLLKISGNRTEQQQAHYLLTWKIATQFVNATDTKSCVYSTPACSKSYPILPSHRNASNTTKKD